MIFMRGLMSKSRANTGFLMAAAVDIAAHKRAV
jgi:hypothetical protein